jgi:hypothetical protein
MVSYMEIAEAVPITGMALAGLTPALYVLASRAGRAAGKKLPCATLK